MGGPGALPAPSRHSVTRTSAVSTWTSDLALIIVRFLHQEKSIPAGRRLSDSHISKTDSNTGTYQRPQGLTVAQVLDVIEATRSGSSAKKFHAAQDLSTISS